MTGALAAIAAGFRGTARADEPMSAHTSLKVGGRADLYLEPADEAALVDLLNRLHQSGIPCLPLGGGFNLLVRDGGIRGCVVSLEPLHRMEILPEGRVAAQAGVTNRELAGFSAAHALSGLEFLSAIPGCLGGSLAVNAGAHGFDLLSRVETLTTWWRGEVAVRGQGELDFGYRYLTLRPGEVVLAATLQLTPGEPGAIEERISGYRSHRICQRVGLPNAGSFFKNPPGAAAWQLIDQAGLRGEGIGGAQVSPVHTNFLVNRGGATSADFLALAALVQERVLARTGVRLEPEVRIVGEEPGAGPKTVD